MRVQPYHTAPDHLAADGHVVLYTHIMSAKAEVKAYCISGSERESPRQ